MSPSWPEKQSMHNLLKGSRSELLFFLFRSVLLNIELFHLGGDEEFSWTWVLFFSSSSANVWSWFCRRWLSCSSLSSQLGFVVFHLKNLDIIIVNLSLKFFILALAKRSLRSSLVSRSSMLTCFTASSWRWSRIWEIARWISSRVGTSHPEDTLCWTTGWCDCELRYTMIRNQAHSPMEHG